MLKKNATLDKIPAQYIKGVGPRLAALLEKRGIYTVQDILFHLPCRYQDRTRITPIRTARADDWVVIEGKISDTQSGRRFICKLNDHSGYIHLLFFHITSQQKSALTAGTRLRCYGEVRLSTQGLTLIHPEYQIISEKEYMPVDDRLTPIYASTEGISQTLWRKITQEALLRMNSENLPDYLSSPKTEFSLQAILTYIHRPPPAANVEQLMQKQHPMQKRLAFEELLAHHLSLRLRREKIKEKSALALHVDEKKYQQFLAQLNFKLTRAQLRVIQEIFHDMSQGHPMLRLIQGDVGSGKTVVAAIAALQVCNSQAQTAFMVPTELLAEQHYKHFVEWFTSWNISILNLTGKLKSKQKSEIIEKIKNHTPLIIIGTHALFQENIVFKKLGLVIIDEQHRFGVEQRLALKQKGVSPHQLMMTATPIPRTLAMTFYADVNVSIIDELPPGRTPVKTVAMPASRREEVIARIQKAHLEKRQIYWVCPLIEESDLLQQQAAETTAIRLRQTLPHLKIGLIHGKLKSDQKDSIMNKFKENTIDVLVATTVIEVGVDVPNASVMIIENAERLGLAQLHQLRGRVGRGNVESYCILLYQSPLSLIAQERLRVIREFQDGFKIAEKDLALRGPGELLGIRQTGVLSLRIADLERDQALFEKIQEKADILFSQSPEKVPLIIDRWLGMNARFQGV
jgi:ATP-dependent DNA helicase RecG